MKYSATKNRTSTDALFSPAPGSAACTGPMDRAARFIQDAQLMDPALWALFVQQFRMKSTDDHDRGWRGEYWGKMMRGACFTYAYTRDEALYRVLEDTVHDMLTVQDEFGRIATYSVPNEFHGWDVWSRKYVLLGMQYFLEICRDDGLAEKVVASMCRQVDYMMAKIGNEGVAKLPITNTSEYWNGLNASSILEPIVRLYNLTGEQKYLDFAKGIIDAGGMRGFDVFEAALEGKLHPYEYPVTKAYEMMSNFEGIIEYYRVTGEEKYRTMAVNFARLVAESDITVIGCAGTTHELFDHSAVRQFDPAFTGIMQETCVTVTWMKLCSQLLALTGDPVYADLIEQSMYNALHGAINFNGNKCKDQVFTFDSYSPLLNGRRGLAVGGYKDIVRRRFWWGCCVAIGAAGTGLVPMSAVMDASDGVAVNLYIPGAYVHGDVTLKVDTAYPVEGTVRITVDLPHEDRFAIRLRIPAWSRESALAVNGEAVEVAAGAYAVLERTWAPGDVIELILDMRTAIIRAASIDPDATPEAICHAALRRGPIVLARDAATGEDITEAVELISADGFAVLEPCQVPFPVQQAYRVKIAEGYITVVDYASAGQVWGDDALISAWVTTK